MEIRSFGDRIQVSECQYETDKPYVAVVAVDRQALVDLLDRCTERQQKVGGEIYGFTITMPCGGERQFLNHCDIPFEDLPCPCGRTGHYLIQYKKE